MAMPGCDVGFSLFIYFQSWVHIRPLCFHFNCVIFGE